MKSVCIHSHFYQPPREDPWHDEVLLDKSAHPSHDWNSRIEKECYTPNRAARLTNAQGRITGIVNNYEHMSFNMGPTLHHWIARHNPVLNHSIKEADIKAAAERGTGGAMAQGYNHTILPLSVDRDIATQVIWGVADFKYRFDRSPLGMWMPETAVDLRTLETMAANGITFTIMAPSQCAAATDDYGTWRTTPGGNGLDVTKPYRVALPSGKSINVFFYYGGIAHDIAFGGLLYSGDNFANRLMSALPSDNEPRILIVATDGETYGHHHRFGEMALARAFKCIFNAGVAVATPAEYLKKHPVVRECRIVERSSWSCAHGVERWRSSCGCHTGGEPWWNQQWRGPLRDALDVLRDNIDEVYESTMRQYCDNPWDLRNQSIQLYLSGEDPDSDYAACHRDFISRYCGKQASRDSKVICTLLEAQRMRMFMYTSCGWFFNDVSGIETVQILCYAVRAAELMSIISGTDFTPELLSGLQKAKSNLSSPDNAAEIVGQSVLPKRRSMEEMAAAAALMEAEGRFYTTHVIKKGHPLPSGDITLHVSNIKITDTRTEHSWDGSTAVLSSNGLDDVCRMARSKLTPDKSIRDMFYKGDLISLGRLLEEHFPQGPWHLDLLVQDDRNFMAGKRNRTAELRHLDDAMDILNDNRRLLLQLYTIGAPPPPFIETAASLALREHIQQIADNIEHDMDILDDNSALDILIDDAHSMGLKPELSILAPRLEEAFHEQLRRLRGAKDESSLAKWLLERWRVMGELDIHLDLWRLQNEMWRNLVRPHTDISNYTLALAHELNFEVPESEFGNV